jgi:hypothetical protein
MAAKIEQLTPEQRSIIPIVRDEWIAHGLSCEPADREAAEDGVRRAYRAVGLDEPELIIWLGSPMAGCIASAMLAQPTPDKVRSQVVSQALSQVRGRVRDQVLERVRDQVLEQALSQVRGRVRDQVLEQALSQVRGRVRDQVGAQVVSQVMNQIGEQVWDEVHRAVWGQHDAGWLAWLDYWARVGLDLPDTAGLLQVGRSAGWWWPRRGIVIITERPTALRRDAEGRLHCEDGPAIIYPDGWAIWAIHGVRVPEWVVTTQVEQITAEMLAREENAEVRRVVVERVGHDRMMPMLGAEVLHEDDYGVLWDAPPLDGMSVARCRWVEVVDASPEPVGSDLPPLDERWAERYRAMTGHAPLPGRRYRRYLIPVPDDVETAHAAVAWHHGMPPEEYVLSGVEAA